MTNEFPSDAGFYRRPSSARVRQGDIALAESVQLRARSGDRLGPGPEDRATEDLPYFGEHSDVPFDIPRAGGGVDARVLRVWQVPVLVLHQNCEIEFGSSDDSRLVVAPITTPETWPEGPWGIIRANRLPGYLYLPNLPAAEAARLNVDLAWGDGAVVLASSFVSSFGLIKARRLLALREESLPGLHDAISRFFGTRGLADLSALQNAEGKRFVRVVETEMTIPGPSRMVKVYFSANEDEPDDGDDEATVAYWGVRTTKRTT